MQYVKDWYDHSEGVIRVKSNRKKTILLFDVKEPYLSLFGELEKEADLNFVIADTLTDLAAIPAILAVVDPSDVLNNDLINFFNLVDDYFGPHDCKYLFLFGLPVQIPGSLKRMIIDLPNKLDKGFVMNIIKEVRESNVVSFQSEFSLIKHFNQT